MVISTPRASRTSAAPDFDDAALLPCFATGTPAAAMTSEDVVDILKELEPSPPVPTISSTSISWSSLMQCALIPAADAVISSIVSPLSASAVRYADICTGVALPLIISFITSSAISYVRSSFLASLSIASFIIFSLPP